MTVTALLLWRIEGRQMCSSTPRVFTPLSRAGFLIRRLASAPIASQAVCQSTPKCRASAETVVSSCRNASTAHAIARVVSLDRSRRSHGSRSTSRPGRPARRNARSACATAPAPADRSTGSRAAERHGGHGRPRRPHTNRSPRAPRRSPHPAPQCRPHGSQATTWTPSTPNISSARAHHDAPGPHIQLGAAPVEGRCRIAD